MNRTKIEWCDMTWNPVIGCKHGCKYCYARRMNNRFKFIADWEKPEFYPERLRKPYGNYKPTKIIPFRNDNKLLIFVVSMGDLFGQWVSDKWIREVIGIAAYCSMHEFMFLTKNPGRYQDFIFSENCWLGATIEKADWNSMEKLSYLMNAQNQNHTNAKTFVSIEPILGSFNSVKFQGIDLIIVGAMTGPGAIKPDPDWIYSIKHPNIFLKNNLKTYNQQNQQ